MDDNDVMDDCFLDFDFEWRSDTVGRRRLCGSGTRVHGPSPTQRDPLSRCPGLVTKRRRRAPLLPECSHLLPSMPAPPLLAPTSHPACQDVELEIQVLPASMDKAWIPNFIEDKVKDLLTFTVGGWMDGWVGEWMDGSATRVRALFGVHHPASHPLCPFNVPCCTAQCTGAAPQREPSAAVVPGHVGALACLPRRRAHPQPALTIGPAALALRACRWAWRTRPCVAACAS